LNIKFAVCVCVYGSVNSPFAVCVILTSILSIHLVWFFTVDMFHNVFLILVLLYHHYVLSYEYIGIICFLADILVYCSVQRATVRPNFQSIRISNVTTY